MPIKKLSVKDYLKLNDFDDSKINRNHFILNFCDFEIEPDIITKKLNLQPTSTGIKGERYQSVALKDSMRFRSDSHWEYELTIETNDYIGDCVNSFFKEIIVPRFKEIKEIASSCEITRLTIVQYYITGNNPGFSLNKKQIKLLAELNAEIDLDIYCLSEDE